MARTLAAFVYVGGRAFEPGSTPPEEFADQITNPNAWTESDTDEPARVDGVPAKAGRGSSQKAWAEYAQAKGVEVDADAARDDIIAACEAAGIPTE